MTNSCMVDAFIKDKRIERHFMERGEDILMQRIFELEAQVQTQAGTIKTLRSLLEQSRSSCDIITNSRQSDMALIEKLQHEVQELTVIGTGPLPYSQDSIENQFRQSTEILDVGKRSKNVDAHIRSLSEELEDTRTRNRTLEESLTKSEEKLKHVQVEKSSLQVQAKSQRELISSLKNDLKKLSAEMAACNLKQKKTIFPNSLLLSASVLSVPPLIEERSMLTQTFTISEFEGTNFQHILIDKELSLLKMAAEFEEKETEFNKNKEFYEEKLSSLEKSRFSEFQKFSEKFNDQQMELERLSISLARNKESLSHMVTSHNLEISVKKSEISKLNERISQLNEELFKEKFGNLCLETCDVAVQKNFGISPVFDEFSQTEEEMTDPKNLMRKLKQIAICSNCSLIGNKVYSLIPCFHSICEKCLDSSTSKDKLLSGIGFCKTCADSLPTIYAYPNKPLERFVHLIKKYRI